MPGSVFMRLGTHCIRSTVSLQFRRTTLLWRWRYKCVRRQDSYPRQISHPRRFPLPDSYGATCNLDTCNRCLPHLGLTRSMRRRLSKNIFVTRGYRRLNLLGLTHRPNILHVTPLMGLLPWRVFYKRTPHWSFHQSCRQRIRQRRHFRLHVTRVTRVVDVRSINRPNDRRNRRPLE